MESGYIYVIQVCNTDGFVKIGFTKSNAEKRLSQLQVGSPYKLRLVASFYFEDVADIEKQLHMKMLLVLFNELVIVNRNKANECLIWIDAFSAQIHEAYEHETEKEDTPH